MWKYDYHVGDWEVSVNDEALKAVVVYLPEGRVVRRFSGESAWSDARRFANDRFVSRRFGK